MELLQCSSSGRNAQPLGWLLPTVAVALLLTTGQSTLAGDDLPSTPRQPGPEQIPPEEFLPESELFATQESLPFAPLVAGTVSVGLDFQASELFDDSGFIPPDTMGAVGPDHIVEMINGNFEIFDKTDGTSLESRSLNSFWTTVAGLSIPQNTCSSGVCTLDGNMCTTTADCTSNFTFDPRIVFDPATDRWFAASLDRDFGAGNNFYIARSDTDDPTDDWDGIQFAADTVGAAEFHDYETLAVDADGFYMCTQDFNGGGNESCYSIPKADLLAAAPSIANMTRFEATPAGLPAVSGSIQPSLDFGSSDGRAALLGVSGGALVRSDILGAGGPGATLGAIGGIAGDPGHAAPPAARQPHPFDSSVTIENVAPRFVANVFEEGDSLWAVHAVQGSGSNSAVRWYEIDETSDTVLQTGLIEDTDQDFYDPSVAVNEFGDVVIGYTCSGPNLAPSVCVSVGETMAGATTFQPPAVLLTGDGHYYRDFRDPKTGLPMRNRWGDYSATVIDPVDPCTFWTFQEFVSVSAVGNVGPAPRSEGGLWGTEATELTFDACAEADLAIAKSDSPDPVVAGTNLNYSLSVENFGLSRARDVEVTDTLPSDVAFSSASGTDWSCAHSAGVVTCDWLGGNPADSLAEGQTASPISVTVAVPPDLVFNGTTSLANVAEVGGSVSDPDTSNNTDTELTSVVAVTDLEILSFDAVDPPAEVLVGEDVALTLSKEITNNGPSGPVDTKLTLAATAPADSTVTPENAVLNEAALGLDEIRAVEEEFTVNCGAASNHTFTFENEITPIGATDPDLGNNDATTEVTLECVVPVIINIKPGSDPNSIQPTRGTIPVAVLTTTAGEGGTPVDFDATTIDPLSVRFGPHDVVFDETGGASERHGRGHIQDAFELDEATKDGDADMVLHFRAEDTGIEPGDTEACVKGDFTNATGTHSFFGCDAIRIVPGAK